MGAVSGTVRRCCRRAQIERHRDPKSMSIATHMSSTSTVADGVLVINKEAGWTSHDIVAKMRAVLGGVKVGHAGTLDPAATGVSPMVDAVVLHDVVPIPAVAVGGEGDRSQRDAALAGEIEDDLVGERVRHAPRQSGSNEYSVGIRDPISHAWAGALQVAWTDCS